MALSAEARNRLFISTTDKGIGKEIADAIDGSAQADLTSFVHTTMMAPSFASSAPGKAPDIVTFGTTIGNAFTIGTDDAFYHLKIQPNYASDGQFHVHWTKAGDNNELGKAVRWRVSYTIVDGATQNVVVAPTVAEIEDTYDDAGTTTRIVHRTSATLVPAMVANYYIFVKIEAITPVGTPMVSAPVLISLDWRWKAYINK